MTLTVARWYNGIDPEGPNCSDIDPALRALKCYIVPPPPQGGSSIYLLYVHSTMLCCSDLWLNCSWVAADIKILSISGVSWPKLPLSSDPFQVRYDLYCTKLDNVLNHGEYWQHQWYGRYKEIVGQCQGCRCDHINHRNSIVSCRHSSSSKGGAKAVNVMVGEYHQRNVGQLPAHMSKRVLFPMETQDVDHRCCSHMWHTEVLSVNYA